MQLLQTTQTVGVTLHLTSIVPLMTCRPRRMHRTAVGRGDVQQVVAKLVERLDVKRTVLVNLRIVDAFYHTSISPFCIFAIV